MDRIAADVEQLGYKAAAAILRERLPRSKTARSGDLGEILASELTEERLGFNVPVRRMRYKDGREVALRGDDFIGAGYDDNNQLYLLKGESKSRIILGKSTVTTARKALNRDNGRCTPHSLLFVADRLLDQNGELEELGRAIRSEVAAKALPPSRIDHALFTVSGNAPPSALTEDFDALGQTCKQTVINFRIEDHQDFIADMYEEAGKLETTDELEQFLQEVTADGFRGQLLDRGTAWSLIRQEGELPPDAPQLGITIEFDLEEYGFSALRAALALRERSEQNETSRRGFERAARAFEALVQNGSPNAVERGFYRVIAAAAYHLASYSAIAYPAQSA